MSSNEDKYANRVDEICENFSEFCEMNHEAHVFIEKPIFYDTAKGYAAAKSDSLAKLIFLYGRLFQIATSTRRTKYRVIPLEIVHWKGQISKAMTKKRIRDSYPDIDLSSKSEDEIDAIGMGLYILGQF